MLQAVGDTGMMACGADSPVDFICVTLVGLSEKAEVASSLTKGRGTRKAKRRLQIRLCDAKLVTSSGRSSTPSISDMPVRFEQVREFLTRHLCGDFDVEYREHAVITTSADIEMPEGMIAISPATCQFPPITDWWFAWAPEQQADDDAGV